MYPAILCYTFFLCAPLLSIVVVTSSLRHCAFYMEEMPHPPPCILFSKVCMNIVPIKCGISSCLLKTAVTSCLQKIMAGRDLFHAFKALGLQRATERPSWFWS